jgi:hypothetical protein
MVRKVEDARYYAEGRVLLSGKLLLGCQGFLMVVGCGAYRHGVYRHFE